MSIEYDRLSYDERGELIDRLVAECDRYHECAKLAEEAIRLNWPRIIGMGELVKEDFQKFLRAFRAINPIKEESSK